MPATSPASLLRDDRATGVSLTLARYIFSHYFYSGVGVACGVVGIAVVTYALFGLTTAAATSTGAMAVSIADVPRAAYLKRRQLTAALMLTTIVTLLVGLTASSIAAQGLLVLAVSFGAAMLTAYGKESLPVSMAVLIMLAIGLGTPIHDLHDAMQHTLLFAAGGVAYLGYALVLAYLLRLRTKQQALAECLYELARYLRIKADFYDAESDLAATYRAVVAQQALMSERLQSARDLAFRDIDNARDGRLASTLIAILDVHEQILASQTDYELMRARYGGSDILAFLRDLALKSAVAIEQISFAVFRNREPRAAVNFKAELFAIRYELDRLTTATPDDAAVRRDIAVLRGIYDNVQLSIAHIEALHAVARTPVEPANVLGGADLERFASRITLSRQPLLDQLKRGSPILRYALRTTLAMGCGYALAYILPYAAHSQWILLTLAVIMRPNFSLTMQRRTDRVIGNAVGCALTAGLLHFSPGPGVVFAGFFVALAVAHTFAPIKYRYTSAAACVMALLNLHLLNPGDSFAVGERLIDTAVGAVLAYIFSYVLPHWESRDLPRLAKALIAAAAHYASATLVLPAKDLDYRLARKRFNDAISALASAFGRMLNEPQRRQLVETELNALITAHYLLAAHLAAVKVLLQRHTKTLDAAYAAQALAETRACVEAELAGAGAALDSSSSDRGSMPGSCASPPLPVAAREWGADVALQHRMEGIVADARAIRALALTIAAPGDR
jgi:uncharacterized membrane protein YccC